MKNLKLVALLVAISFLGILLFPNLTFAATTAELQTQINALMAQIQSLQAQISQQGTVAQWCYDFNSNLRIDDRGAGVRALHTALEKEGFNVGTDKDTNTLDDSTASAVSGFQQKYKDEILTPLALQYGTGFVGKATRNKLNSLYGCGNRPQPPVSTQPPINQCPQYMPPSPDYIKECENKGGRIESFKNEKGCWGPSRCIEPTTNQLPTISGVSGPTTLSVNQLGTWTVKASDPEQGVLSYSVLWGDEPAYAAASLAPRASTYTQTTTFTHSYSRSGIFYPTFTVTDEKGQSAKTSISVNVGGTVVVPSITVLSPNGGEVWRVGETYSIKWTSSGDVKYVSISISMPNFEWGATISYLPNTGRYDWRVPIEAPTNNNYKVTVRDYYGSYPTDSSNSPFSIVAATPPVVGSLTLSLVSGSGASPSHNQLVNVGANSSTYFAFKMTSQGEAQKITSLKLTASGNLATTTLQNIKLYEGSTSAPFATAVQFDTCDTNKCTGTFVTADNLLASPVPTIGEVTIYVKADVSPGGIARLGDNFKFMIASPTDVKAKGAISGSTSATITGTPTASGITYVVPQNVVIEAVAPTSPTQIGLGAEATVGVFRIRNNGTTPIYLSSAIFSNSGSATPSLTFSLYSSIIGGAQNDSSITYSASTVNESFYVFDIAGASNANRKIDGGSWRYLTIKTNGLSNNNDTYRFAVSDVGHIVYSVYESDLGYDANGDGDMSDTIYNLPVDGTPSLETVTARNGFSTNAPIVTFTVNPNILFGQSTLLSWSSTGATSCISSGDGISWGWPGARFTSGTQYTPELTTTQTYTMSCTGAGGTTSKSVTVNVAASTVVIEAVFPINPTQVGLVAGATVGVFRIRNNGSTPIYLNNAYFSNSGSATSSVSFALYASVQGGTQSDSSITYGGTTASGVSSYVVFSIKKGAGVSDANRRIDGGSYRYLTIKTTAPSNNGNTYQFSVSALGNVFYSVQEAELGYDANNDGDIVDTIYGLYVDGTPSLETVTSVAIGTSSINQTTNILQSMRGILEQMLKDLER